MKLKEIIITVAGLICAVSTSAFADVDLEIKDSVNAIYTVSGKVDDTTKTDEPVNIFVIKKGEMGDETKLDSLLSEGKLVSDNLIHQGSVQPNPDGSFTYDFGIPTPDGFVDAWFDVYAGGAAFSAVEHIYDNYYVSFETTKEKAKEIADLAKAGKNSDGTYNSAKIGELAKKFEEYKYIININTNLYKEASKENLAKRLADYSGKWGLDFDKDSEKSVAVLQAKIKEQSLLDCFENSKSSVIFVNGEYAYKDMFAIEPEDNETDTIYELYNSLNCGKDKVKNDVLGKRFADGGEVAKAFKKLVIKNAISSGIDSTLGYGYIDKILTASNISAAELSVPKYAALLSKSNANSNIYNKRASLTIENLESVIEESTASSSETTPGSGNGGYKGSTSPSKRNNSSTVSVPVNPTPDTSKEDKFGDLESVSWAKEAIEALSEKKIISGYGDGNFKPNNSITRAETAKIIVTAFEMKELQADKTFDDVKDGDWYANYVNKLVANGYMNGYSESVFGAADGITRQDFAVTLYRVIGKPEAESETEFTDSQDIADYAKAAVNYLASKKIISGFEDGSFRPNEIITRAQAAKIIYELTK